MQPDQNQNLETTPVAVSIHDVTPPPLIAPDNIGTVISGQVQVAPMPGDAKADSNKLRSLLSAW